MTHIAKPDITIRNQATYHLINQLQSFQIGAKPEASAKTSDFKAAIRATIEKAAYNKSHLQEKYPHIIIERNSNIAIKKPADLNIGNNQNQVSTYA